VNRFRSAAIAASLALALAVPASALAASTTGTTTEAVNVGLTVSMVVPASVTYTVIGGHATGELALTDLGTNNTGGMYVQGTFSALTGPVTIPYTSRTISTVAAGGGLVMANLFAPALEAGEPAVRIMQTDAPVAAGTASWGMDIAGMTVPGVYSGSIVFMAATR
jgi:hypothetical protein